jgi:hypothetical protein
VATRREEVRVTADVSNFVTKFAAAGQAADGFARKLEDADGRMANLVQAGLALAPALVPLGAAAVPAIAGLTTQLGFAALAAGTAALAFEGIGTAVTALNTYKLAPTAAHFQALQLAMDKLGPSGQEFVLSMQKIRPEFDRLRNLAEKGLLPGVADGMNELLTLAPQVESVLFTTSTTLGNLVREGADNLTDDRWTKFFDYLNVTAGPILSDMGRTLGNVIEGIANMVMAFDPLSRSFSTGLLDMSRSFREWSDNLGSSQGLPGLRRLRAEQRTPRDGCAGVDRQRADPVGRGCRSGGCCGAAGHLRARGRPGGDR